MGGTSLNRPIVGMSSTPDGKGYWMVASDGGIFSFGDASFYGSMGGTSLTSPVVSIATTPTGQGYLMASAGNYDSPALLTPLFANPPTNEGHWSPLGSLVNGVPVVFSTMLQPAPQSTAASVVLIKQNALHAVLYAGYDQPQGNWINSTAIPSSLMSSVIASFNGGFRLDASEGGFYTDGVAAVPLRAGAASFVIHNDGSVSVGMWGRDFSLSNNVSQVRQNLNLLVDGAKPATDVGNYQDWGATVGNVTNTWRSAVGTDQYGDLIYISGPNLSPAELATLLIRAGVIEGMQLDINPSFPLLVSYDNGVPIKLRSDMFYGADHYITRTERDFFAFFS